MLEEAQLWEAVQPRDKALDGRFFYGVLTTGIFCRPGCPSRQPRPENVRFLATAGQAQANGLRCKPLEAAAAAERAKFDVVCDFIRGHLEEPGALKLDKLSHRSGLSPFHFNADSKLPSASHPGSMWRPFACRVSSKT